MTKLDMSREAVARREAEISRRMAGSTLTSHDRAAERRKIEADVEAEEIAATKAVNDRSEADQERARIASVVKLGRDRDRGRQALRAALLAPIGPEAAFGLIGALPRDDAASADALAVPGFSHFGSPAAQQERKRIASAFARPEAEGRFAAVCAIVLDGDASLTAEQVAPLLATMPIAPAMDFDKYDIGKRAEGLTEIGGEYEPIQSRGERLDSMWGRAVKSANAGIGAAPAPTAAPASPEMGLDDPRRGMTPDGIAAFEAARAARASGA